MKIPNIIKVPAAGLLLAIGFSVHALGYNDQDALLIFRADGYNNVEFNIGNIGQFLNRTNGYQTTVTNWSLDVVNSNFALTNGLAQFFILASTSDQDAIPRAWITDNQPLRPASDDTPSQWEFGLYGVIAGTGFGIQTDPNAPPNTNYDVVSPTSKYAFDYIASNAGQTPAQIPLLGGGSGLQFSSAGSIPGTVLFYEITASTVTPKPAATLVGSFNLSASGILTFQAGPLLDAARITAISSGPGSTAITFNSVAAVKYRLRASGDLTSALSAWPVLPGPVVGDGTPQTLYDNSAGNGVKFYAVESYQ